MRFTRIAALCAVAALAMSTGARAQDIRTTAGPLERAARPVTPENPIPRRTFSIPAAYPAEARSLEAVANVMLRVTLDHSGRVAEVRRMTSPLVRVGRLAPSDAIALQSAGEAMVRSAAAAVSQWQYDPPADAPLSFSVSFGFRPNAETTSTQSTWVHPEYQITPPPSVRIAVADDLAIEWPAAQGALRAGGQVRAPEQIRHVAPVYPANAIAAGVQGVVMLAAVIGEDGRVRDVRLLRSIPMLDQAAIDAVKQWEYVRSQLNGTAVPVVIAITVQFRLPAPITEPPPSAFPPPAE